MNHIRKAFTRWLTTAHPEYHIVDATPSESRYLICLVHVSKRNHHKHYVVVLVYANGNVVLSYRITPPKGKTIYFHLDEKDLFDRLELAIHMALEQQEKQDEQSAKNDD